MCNPPLWPHFTKDIWEHPQLVPRSVRESPTSSSDFLAAGNQKWLEEAARGHSRGSTKYGKLHECSVSGDVCTKWQQCVCSAFSSMPRAARSSERWKAHTKRAQHRRMANRRGDTETEDTMCMLTATLPTSYFCLISNRYCCCSVVFSPWCSRNITSVIGE